MPGSLAVSEQGNGSDAERAKPLPVTRALPGSCRSLLSHEAALATLGAALPKAEVHGSILHSHLLTGSERFVVHLKQPLVFVTEP